MTKHKINNLRHIVIETNDTNVQQNYDVLYLLCDMDGCCVPKALLDRDIARKTEESDLKDSPIPNFIFEEADKFQVSTIQLGLGTNRGSLYLDVFNAEKSRTTSLCGVLEGLTSILKKKYDEKFTIQDPDTTMLADDWLHEKYGHHYSVILTALQPNSPALMESDRKDRKVVFDETKLTLLIARAHSIARNNPNKKIRMILVDDKAEEFAKGAGKFLGEYTFLLPKSVTLVFVKYDRFSTTPQNLDKEICGSYCDVFDKSLVLAILYRIAFHAAIRRENGASDSVVPYNTLFVNQEHNSVTLNDLLKSNTLNHLHIKAGYSSGSFFDKDLAIAIIVLLKESRETLKLFHSKLNSSHRWREKQVSWKELIEHLNTTLPQRQQRNIVIRRFPFFPPSGDASAAALKVVLKEKNIENMSTDQKIDLLTLLRTLCGESKENHALVRHDAYPPLIYPF